VNDVLLGFQRLAEMYGVNTAQPLITRSCIGPVRSRELVNGQEIRIWPTQYRPEDTFQGHFEFGLKYDRLNFEFFSRLFHTVDPDVVAAWVRSEPTGAYARRTAFLYEWFTGQRLDVPDTAPNVGYVDAIDSRQYLTATHPERCRRWRVNDNLPGVAQYCPLLYLGPPDEHGWIYDVAAGVQSLDETYGPELLLRCSAWLTLKESRASFAIEHEADKDDRIKRFAAAIGQYSGKLVDPMGSDELLTLQQAVLGDAALRLGIRQSPVFVGQNSFRRQIVHYIAPQPELVPEMLDALRHFEVRTRGAHPVVRAAVISFAFVYLHPLADGNGRVHRFLVNHLLAADKAVPANIVVPVSATIAGSARGHAEYDQVLEVISKPFMQRYATAYRFGERRVCPDGVETDFEFEMTEDAQRAWRFPDLTAHALYMSGILQQTVEHEMAQEAQLLRQHDEARGAIKRIVEMPDNDADRIIRSLKESQWIVSNKLKKGLPEIFAEEGKLYRLSESLVNAVRNAFQAHNEAEDH